MKSELINKIREADLFPALKKHFKEQGYTVYAEVPCFYRGVDFVAVKGEDHIAVEMKLSFNNKVIQQANSNTIAFGKSYVAFPLKEAILYHNSDTYWKLKDTTRDKIEKCRQRGIGILQIVGKHRIIFEALEAKYQKPYRVFDFSIYKESEEDEAGLPCQKGVSAGYYELENLKEYLKSHPKAGWKEIWGAVQNHYSSPSSMASSMKQWRGFSLVEFRNSL